MAHIIQTGRLRLRRKFRHFRWVFGPTAFNLRIARLQIYDAAGNGIIPAMTADNTPSPFLVYSSEVPYSTLYRWKAFTPAYTLANSFGTNAAASGQWIQIDCGGPYDVERFAWWSVDGTDYASQTPTEVTLLASEDGLDFSVLVAAGSLVWARGECKEFRIDADPLSEEPFPWENMTHHWPLTADANDRVGDWDLSNTNVAFSDLGGYFNGGAYLVKASTLWPDPPCTLTFELRPVAATPSADRGIFGQYTGTINTNVLGFLHPNNGSPYLDFRYSGNLTWTGTAGGFNFTDFPTTAHKMIAVVVPDTATIRAYRGVIALGGSVAGAAGSKSGNIVIGADRSYRWLGYLRNFRIWDKALSVSELLALSRLVE